VLEPTPAFLPGLELSRRLYVDAVQPILAAELPSLRYAAGLLGAGSEVLGLDTERSTDHDWGARLLIMVDEQEPAATYDAVDDVLNRRLPARVAGFPTRFTDSPLEPGTPVLDPDATHGRHGVRVGTVARLVKELGVDALADVLEPDRLDPAFWLTVSEQHLLEVTAGLVWRDDLGTLTRVRSALAWYPDDVWRYRLSSEWMRIAQHEAFIGRTGEVGDDLGSHLVTTALIRDVVYLAFLLERRCAPYEKWLGTAFARLGSAAALQPALDRARYGADWTTREAAVVEAVQVLAERQNALGLAAVVDPTPRRYFNRPFTVLFAERFAAALDDAVTDPRVRALPEHLGGIDQYVETTNGREQIDLHRAIRAWLRTAGEGQG